MQYRCLNEVNYIQEAMYLVILGGGISVMPCTFSRSSFRLSLGNRQLYNSIFSTQMLHLTEMNTKHIS